MSNTTVSNIFCLTTLGHHTDIVKYIQICLYLVRDSNSIFRSIYDGDEQFAIVEGGKKFQYKFGEDGTSKSFILEISWNKEYPEVLPDISVDAFYNKHLKSSVKQDIVEFVKTEAEQYLGMSMTYTIFEQVKENLETLLNDQPDEMDAVKELTEDFSQAEIRDERTSVKETSPKKEQLTKAQKRKMWNKGGLDTDDRPRGWNWVDIVKHLSQTGPQNE